jgi:molecular chaperone GrpE
MTSKSHSHDEPIPDALSAAEKRLKEKHIHEQKEATHQELEKLRAQVAEFQALKDQMLRRAADFDNAKKRLEREKDEIFNYAHEEVLKKMLPVVDNLDRALISAKELKAPEGVLTGLELIGRQLLDILKQFQVEPIEALGKPFNPHFHEAVSHLESDEAEGTVVGELQKGYMFKNKLLRASSVQTAAPKKTQ